MRVLSLLLLSYVVGSSFLSQIEAFVSSPMPMYQGRSYYGSFARPAVASTSICSLRDGTDDRIRISSNRCETPRKSGVFPTSTATMMVASLFKIKSSAATAPASVSALRAAFSISSLSQWQPVFALSSLLILAQTCSAALGQISSMSMAWYVAKLATNPVLTKSITAAVIGAVGDFGAQWLEHKLSSRVSNKRIRNFRKSYDARRGLSIALDGLFISGPLMHLGYEMFEAVLPINGLTGGARSLAAVAHVVADSLLLDSVFVATTFLVTGVIEGYSFRRQLLPQFQKDYIPTIKAGLATSFMLMPIEFACFRLLPLSLRVLAVNFIDVVWDAVISFMAHRNRHKSEQDSGEEEMTKTSESSFPFSKQPRQPALAAV